MGKGGRGFVGNDANTSENQPSPNESITAAAGPFFDWSQIKDEKNKWFVIDGKVYDVQHFAKKHPGGERLMMNHVGQDVTDAFNSFHIDMKKVNKYLANLEIGYVAPDSTNGVAIIGPDGLIERAKEDELTKDFRDLKSTAESMGLYKTKPSFYILNFIHIILIEIAASILIFKSGYESWFSYSIAAILLTIVQSQASWLQHDFGHLSVLDSSKQNHFVQKFLINFVKGYSGDWWNFRHYQHHAKPNVVRKDPDIRFGTMFMLGKVIPRELGAKKIGSYPYKLQQFYFFLVVPPLIMPVYFILENIYYLIKKKDWKELALTATFFVKWFVLFSYALGFMGALKFFFLVKFLDSHWFTWVTQMNHLPMHIDRDHEMSWFRTQLASTCNVNQSWFNDWFTGHLNFQIEHHLFPTMPRHSYAKVAPLVKSLCDKHNIDYIVKPLPKAMADIYRSLKESGEMWYDAYNLPAE